jgi:hypothetical protein
MKLKSFNEWLEARSLNDFGQFGSTYVKPEDRGDRKEDDVLLRKALEFIMSELGSNGESIKDSESIKKSVYEVAQFLNVIAGERKDTAYFTKISQYDPHKTNDELVKEFYTSIAEYYKKTANNLQSFAGNIGRQEGNNPREAQAALLRVQDELRHLSGSIGGARVRLENRRKAT